MESELCLFISERLLRIVENSTKELEFQSIFRHASGGIAYLLRRRAHDLSYLDPASSLGKETKAAFYNAIREVKRHPEEVLGGFVKIDEQLKLIIDYIDRKGHGPIIIGIE